MDLWDDGGLDERVIQNREWLSQSWTVAAFCRAGD